MQPGEVSSIKELKLIFSKNFGEVSSLLGALLLSFRKSDVTLYIHIFMCNLHENFS